eukprot:3595982-Rhodomonas_salina.1
MSAIRVCMTPHSIECAVVSSLKPHFRRDCRVVAFEHGDSMIGHGEGGRKPALSVPLYWANLYCSVYRLHPTQYRRFNVVVRNCSFGYPAGVPGYPGTRVPEMGWTNAVSKI